MSIATKCTCGHSLTGVCASSVKECRQLKKEKTQLPVDAELITEDRLKQLGFEFVDYGDDPPYETYRKDGIEVSEYNGECWLIEMLDQNNIERPLKYLSELEAFFNGCGKSIYGATAYATRLHQVEQENEELRRQNDKMKQQAEGWRPLLEETLSEWDSMVFEMQLKDKITKFLYGE